MGRERDRRRQEDERRDPAKTIDLQQRKAKEQCKIKEGKRYKDDEWLDVERRKNRYKEELEYKNKVTYFVSNLPAGCTWAGLWEAFKHHKNLMDTSVPSKKERWGNTFGFLRFVDVIDKEAFMEDLRETKVDGRKIWITISKWGRRGRGALPSETTNRGTISKATTNPPSPPPPPPPLGSRSHHEANSKFQRSYRDAAVGSFHNPQSVVVRITDEKSIVHPDAHPLKLSSLIGTTHDLMILNNLMEHLVGLNGLQKCSVRYLGGLTIILTFVEEDEAKNYLEQKVCAWSKIFSSLKVWDGRPPPAIRVAWITIMGVPPHLCDNNIMDQIGRVCGTVIAGSNMSILESNLSFDRIPILTNFGPKIDKGICLSHNNEEFFCWVREDDEIWVPEFLSKDNCAIQKCIFEVEGSGDSHLPNEPSDMHQSQGGSSSANSGHQSPDFDGEFETSMSVRDIGDGNAALMANGQHIMRIMDIEHNNCLGDQCSSIGKKAADKGNGSHSSHLNKRSGSHSPLLNNNGLDLNDTVQNKSFISPSNSDPFNLGPIINKIMAQSYCSTVGSGYNSGFINFASKENSAGKTLKIKKTKGVGKKFRVPDLNIDAGDLSRFKLSRYLLSRKKRTGSKKKVKSFPTQASNSSSHSSRSHNWEGCVGDDDTSGNRNDNEDWSHNIERGSQVVIDGCETREPNSHLSSEINSSQNSEINEEIANTIYINSLVHIDLNGHEDHLAENIRNEGVNSGHP
ncbi:hypothetical protein QVD17_06501 [Tagetes erecta]|uniref:RRM domain-containing protein n=1 Tax=Tagetes erecta TaxID=13708 RepID=A0AAD8PC98_TARER|nr:hypothetical protein QVD17_06501 [Tagetes erecta]